MPARHPQPSRPKDPSTRSGVLESIVHSGVLMRFRRVAFRFREEFENPRLDHMVLPILPGASRYWPKQFDVKLMPTPQRMAFCQPVAHAWWAPALAGHLRA